MESSSGKNKAIPIEGNPRDAVERLEFPHSSNTQQSISQSTLCMGPKYNETLADEHNNDKNRYQNTDIDTQTYPIRHPSPRYKTIPPPRDENERKRLLSTLMKQRSPSSTQQKRIKLELQHQVVGTLITSDPEPLHQDQLHGKLLHQGSRLQRHLDQPLTYSGPIQKEKAHKNKDPLLDSSHTQIKHQNALNSEPLHQELYNKDLSSQKRIPQELVSRKTSTPTVESQTSIPKLEQTNMSPLNTLPLVEATEKPVPNTENKGLIENITVPNESPFAFDLARRRPPLPKLQESKQDKDDTSSCVVVESLMSSSSSNDEAKQPNTQSWSWIRNDFNHDYPNAPLAEIWVNSNETRLPKSSGLDQGGTNLGRRLVWDEGYFSDSSDHCLFDRLVDIRNQRQEQQKKNFATVVDLQESVEEKPQSFTLAAQPSKITRSANIQAKQEIQCLKNRVQLDALSSLASLPPPPPPRPPTGTTTTAKKKTSTDKVKPPISNPVTTRRGKCRMSSGGANNNEPMSNHVVSELASGKLCAHTLIECQPYAYGPELRFLLDENERKEDDDLDEETYKAKVLSTVGETQTLTDVIQPFKIRISPDASFLIDFHVHLATSEVIGLLGGEYVPSERCVYVQVNPASRFDRS